MKDPRAVTMKTVFRRAPTGPAWVSAAGSITERTLSEVDSIMQLYELAVPARRLDPARPFGRRPRAGLEGRPQVGEPGRSREFLIPLPCRSLYTRSAPRLTTDGGRVGWLLPRAPRIRRRRPRRAASSARLKNRSRTGSPGRRTPGRMGAPWGASNGHAGTDGQQVPDLGPAALKPVVLFVGTHNTGRGLATGGCCAPAHRGGSTCDRPGRSRPMGPRQLTEHGVRPPTWPSPWAGPPARSLPGDGSSTGSSRARPGCWSTTCGPSLEINRRVRATPVTTLEQHGGMSIHPIAQSFDTSADDYERGRPTSTPRRSPGWPRRCACSRAPPWSTWPPAPQAHPAAPPTGAAVVAVEPLAGMREVLARAVPGVRVLEGTAESIPLPTGQADTLTVGRRSTGSGPRGPGRDPPGPASRGPPWAAVEPAGPSQPLQAELDEAVDRHRGEAPSHTSGRWRQAFEETDLFGPLRTAEFALRQELDADGVVARMLSISFNAGFVAHRRGPISSRSSARLWPATASRSCSTT